VHSPLAHLQLVPMTAGHLPLVVAQHLEQFPHGFFARLGPRFLIEYYAAFCTSAAAFAVVATRDGDIAGYLVGRVSADGHRRHALGAHGRRLATRGALGLARQPRVMLAFLRTRARRYLRKLGAWAFRGDVAVRTELESVAILDYVVVREEFRGLGLGSQLIGSFEAECRRRGVEKIVLVTDVEGPAVEYYHATGWSALSEHASADGRLLVTLCRRVLPPIPEQTSRCTGLLPGA
jgi:GNAT superfamily N-acetyltransferase